ncbi:MAG TPA: ion transporter [Oscillatoriales cyanobacterium M59_W2019_021]|nr:MAG: ion transporter [Cyanobacteria bacterium J055]HIK33487.1 ion transporter [Oscillatoriales cyanobacterium M4454_W2019_049]HIK50227.1 ion transporter [Oscillatoriales cyanobacterium M59_W2019_021]
MISRQDLAFYLDDVETPIGRAISLTLTGLILLSAIFFVAETYPLSEDILSGLRILDTTIVVIFSLEYGLRCWATDSPLKFVLSPIGILEFLIISTFFLGFCNVVFVRIFRWFRILRLIRFLDFEILSFQLNEKNGEILTQILFTLFAIIFIFSGLIYQVEHPVNPHIFRHFLDAFYFSVVTMTTVGFGDVIPLSETGRCLTLLMIITGVVLIPWQVGALIEHLVQSGARPSPSVEKICSGCGHSRHDRDARFCKMCGTELSHQ